MRHCWRSTNDEVNQSFPFSEVSFLDLECHDGGPPGVSVGSLGLTCGWRTGSGNWIGTCTDCICWDRRTRSLLSLRLCQHHCLGGSRTVTSCTLTLSCSSSLYVSLGRFRLNILVNIRID